MHIMYVLFFVFFFLIMRRPQISTLFPHTTLFRSVGELLDAPADVIERHHDQHPVALLRPVRRGDRARHLHHPVLRDRKSTRLNSSHANISYAVFCLKKKKTLVLTKSAKYTSKLQS